MKKDDYLIYKVLSEKSPTKFYLAQAVKPVDGGLLVTEHEDIHIKRVQTTIEKWQVVINLGDKPEAGKVYGHDLGHLFKRTVSTDCGSDVHLFTDLKPKAEAKSLEGLVSAKKVLKKHGLGSIHNQPIFLEIHNKKEKYAGMFKPSKDHSKIILNVTDLNMSELYSDYVYIHEYAHAIDHYYLSKSTEIMARWVRLYLQTIKPSTLSLKDARTLYKPMKGMLSISEWRKNLTEEQQPMVGLVLRHIKQSHKAVASDITKLLAADDHETIKAFWPTEDIHSTELAPLISEYATKNVAETIAESLAYYMLGRKLPKGIVTLCEDSIQYAIGAA